MNGELLCWYVTSIIENVSLMPGDSVEVTVDGLSKIVIVAHESITSPFFVVATLCGLVIECSNNEDVGMYIVNLAENLKPPLTCLSCLADISERSALYRGWLERNR
jgi:hypothetical protein